MKEKRKETTKKERRKAIYLSIYATILLLVPLLALIIGLDEVTPIYIIATIIAAILVFVGSYTFVMFLNNYYRDNQTEETKNLANKIVKEDKK